MSKILYNKVVLFLVIIVCSGTLSSTPLQPLGIQFDLLLLILFFCLFIRVIVNYLTNKGKSLNINILYFIVLASLPVMGAITANIVFGQSFLSGLTSNYLFFNYLVIVYIYFYFKNRPNALTEIKNIVIFLGWFYLIAYYIIRLAIPDFTYEVPSYDGTTSYIFKAYALNSPFIIWAGMIYLSKHKQSPKVKYLLMFLFFY